MRFVACPRRTAELPAHHRRLKRTSNEPHGPRDKGDPSQYPPESLKSPPVLVDTAETRKGFSNHLAEVTYFDSQVGELVGLLDQSPQRDNTLVIVLSEQGDEGQPTEMKAFERMTRKAKKMADDP